MRMAPLPAWVGAATLRRTAEPGRAGERLWVVTPAVLPATVATVAPSTWRVKSRVLKPALSPPAAAWRTTIWSTAKVPPRSTSRKRGAELEQNLSLLPPEALPFTALAGPSPALQAGLPLAGRFRARLGREGAAS